MSARLPAGNAREGVSAIRYSAGWEIRATLSARLSLGIIQGRKEKPMSTITQKRLITAEEFFLLPDPGDGSQQELVRGEVITMPPPGGMHGVSCNKAGRRLGNFVEDN